MAFPLVLFLLAIDHSKPCLCQQVHQSRKKHRVTLWLKSYFAFKVTDLAAICLKLMLQGSGE